MIKYVNIAVMPLMIGDIILTRKPISAEVGSMEKMRPTKIYSGAPGGCGTPRMYEQAMNSPQSQKDVVIAIVLRYVKKLARKITPAMTALV